MRRCVLALVLALSACSSGSGTTSLASPSAPPSTALTPGTAVTTAPASSSPQASLSPLTTGAPTPRRTASPTRSPRPSPTASKTKSPTPSPTRAGKTYTIDEVLGDRFSPSHVTLRVGDGVLVENSDSTDHTFTVSALGKDSGNMGPGATYRLTFTKAGSFAFVCSYHENLGMSGSVTVTA